MGRPPNPLRSAERLRRAAKAVCRYTIPVTAGVKADSDGYIVNDKALERLADLLNKLPTFVQKVRKPGNRT